MTLRLSGKTGEVHSSPSAGAEVTGENARAAWRVAHRKRSHKCSTLSPPPRKNSHSFTSRSRPILPTTPPPDSVSSPQNKMKWHRFPRGCRRGLGTTLTRAGPISLHPDPPPKATRRLPWTPQGHSIPLRKDRPRPRPPRPQRSQPRVSSPRDGGPPSQQTRLRPGWSRRPESSHTGLLRATSGAARISEFLHAGPAAPAPRPGFPEGFARLPVSVRFTGL